MVGHTTAGSLKQRPSHWKPNSVKRRDSAPRLLILDSVDISHFVIVLYPQKRKISTRVEEIELHKTQGKWQTLYERLCKQIEVDRRGHFTSRSIQTGQLQNTLGMTSYCLSNWTWQHTFGNCIRAIINNTGRDKILRTVGWSFSRW